MKAISSIALVVIFGLTAVAVEPQPHPEQRPQPTRTVIKNDNGSSTIVVRSKDLTITYNPRKQFFPFPFNLILGEVRIQGTAKAD